MVDHRYRVLIKLSSLLIGAGAAMNAFALDALPDEALSAVTGQDGITVRFSGPTITADQIAWTLDEDATDPSNLVDPSLENSIHIGKLDNAGDGITIKPVGIDGADLVGGQLGIETSIDAFTGPGGASLALDTKWSRMRVQLDSMSVSDDSRTFGQVAIDTAGRLALIGDGGLFNSTNENARFILNVGNVVYTDPSPTNWTVTDPGQLNFRMDTTASTELRLDNLALLLDMNQGIVGIDDQGFILQSAAGSRTDFNLTFDVVANANSSFVKNPADDLPLLYFGWRGGLDDFLFRLKPEGTRLGDGSITQGVTASLGFNLLSDFQFVAGEAGGDHSYLEFTNPVSLPNSLYPDRKDVEFGSITLDAVSATQGVGGICFGGSNSIAPLSSCSAESFASLPAEIIDLPPTDSGLALIARDWGLHAYSSSVSYRDGTNSDYDVEDEGWALIYTLGDVNGNFYLYPKVGEGISADVTAAIQTIGTTEQQRWQNGTHFLIGDTDKNMAIGLLGADLLFASRQMDIDLAIYSGGLRFQSDQGTRIHLRGMFGGGDIPNMASPVHGAYIDANLEFDEFSFSLLPDLAKDKINFGGFLSFANLNNTFSNQTGGAHGHDDGSYFSISEPDIENKLNVDLRLADITGDIEIPVGLVGQGGVIDLIPASGEADKRPKLKVSANIKFGETASNLVSGGSGDPFRINSVEFGGKKLGSIVIPSGQMYGAITLKQQL